MGDASGFENGLLRPQRRVPTLGELAIRKCVANVSRLTDVGSTPFHLLQPVLLRMNAKQLLAIENTSPQITPHSDSLWHDLVAKDFPERPASEPALVAGESSTPHRTLYQKYVEEREAFRNDSTARLRSMNEKLKRKKSANSIVSVPGLFRDPTVRRARSYNYTGGSSYGPPRNNTILGKAKRDVQSRSLIFRAPKKYDPYDAFKHRDAILVRPHRTPSNPTKKAPKTTVLAQPTTAPILQLPKKPENAPGALEAANVSPKKQGNGEEAAMALKRRKTQPSIFLNARKRTPAAGPRPSRVKSPKEAETDPEKPRPITPIKSSIFTK